MTEYQTKTIIILAGVMIGVGSMVLVGRRKPPCGCHDAEQSVPDISEETQP